MDQPPPSLIEPGIKLYLQNSLQSCHLVRMNYNNLKYNVIAGALLFIFISVILVIKYRGKLTPEEKKKKEQVKKEYILSRIQNFQESRQKIQEQLITGLPAWV